MLLRLAVLSVLIVISSFSAAAQIESFLMKQAQTLVQADQAKNYKGVVDLIHPSVIKLMGSKELMVKFLEETIPQLTAQGVTVGNVVLGQPGAIFEGGGDLFCLIPKTVIMTTPVSKLKVSSALLAVSSNKGLDWLFLEIGPQINNTNIKEMLPNFNDDLKFLPLPAPESVN